MRGLTLSYRLVAAALVAAVALLAVGGISFSPRQTHANIPNPTGVFCGALSNLRIDTVVQPGFQGITLARIEDPTGPATLAFTGTAYTAFGGPAFPACAAGTGTPPVPAVSQTGGRPIATGTWTPSGPGGTGASTACALGLSLGSPVPIPGWSKLIVNIPITKPGTIAGSFQLRSNQTPGTCASDNVGGTTAVFDIDVAGAYIAGCGPTATVPPCAHDWDGDGTSDWNELAVTATTRRDPLFANEFAVGGVAEIDASAAAPLAATESSDSNTGLIFSLAAVISAGVVAFGGLVWLARRRAVHL